MISTLPSTIELFRDFLTRTRMFYDLMLIQPDEVYAACIMSKETIDIVFPRNEVKRRELYEILVERGVPKSRLNRAVFRIARSRNFAFKWNGDSLYGR